MHPLFQETWSPYAVGVGIGMLVWLSLMLSDKAIGCSTAFARTSGMSERLLRGKRVHEKLYYQEFTPHIDWEWMLVLGVIVGGFLSALLSGSLAVETVPRLWQAAFGSSIVLRMAVALTGGICIGFGARLAGGCTSGHGISGALQLAAGSWIALCCFFIGGILTALVVIEWLGGA